MGCINSLLPYLVLQLQPPLCKNIKKQFRESSTVTSCQGVFFYQCMLCTESFFFRGRLPWRAKSKKFIYISHLSGFKILNNLYCFDNFSVSIIWYFKCREFTSLLYSCKSLYVVSDVNVWTLQQHI